MSNKVKDLKNQYLEYLEIEKGRSQKTLENYGRYLDRFINFAKIETVSSLSEDVIRQYRLHLNRIRDSDNQPLKRVTQNYHVIALRNFLKYLAKIQIKAVTAERIELGKQEDRSVTFLERDELQKILESPDTKSIDGLRDRAIFSTLFSTGLRVSELCSLNKDKIDLNRGEFSVRGKGSKIRLVFLSEDSKDDIKNYLARRKDVDEALFVRIPKGGSFSKFDNLRLTPRSVQRIVKKYTIKAGIIGKEVTPHTIRHSYATDLLRNGADIRSVQAMLGHSSVTTTQIYTHVTDKQLRDVHKKFHGKK